MPRAPSEAPGATFDVNRDTRADGPTIAMNTRKFGRTNRSDHHVLQLQHQHREESSQEGRGGFCHLAHDGQAWWFRRPSVKRPGLSDRLSKPTRHDERGRVDGLGRSRGLQRLLQRHGRRGYGSGTKSSPQDRGQGRSVPETAQTSARSIGCAPFDEVNDSEISPGTADLCEHGRSDCRISISDAMRRHSPSLEERRRKPSPAISPHADRGLRRSGRAFERNRWAAGLAYGVASRSEVDQFSARHRNHDLYRLAPHSNQAFGSSRTL
jgi:hypothetical protein